MIPIEKVECHPPWVEKIEHPNWEHRDVTIRVTVKSKHLPLFLIGVPLLDMGKIVTDALCDKYLKRPDDVK